MCAYICESSLCVPGVSSLRSCCSSSTYVCMYVCMCWIYKRMYVCIMLMHAYSACVCAHIYAKRVFVCLELLHLVHVVHPVPVYVCMYILCWCMHIVRMYVGIYMRSESLCACNSWPRSHTYIHINSLCITPQYRLNSWIMSVHINIYIYIHYTHFMTPVLFPDTINSLLWLHTIDWTAESCLYT